MDQAACQSPFSGLWKASRSPGDTVEFECEAQYCFIRYLSRGQSRTARVYPEREYVFEKRNGRWAVYRFRQ